MTVTVKTMIKEIHSDVKKLDFTRIKYKLMSKDENPVSQEAVEEMELEYLRYLTLIKLYPGQSFVPTEQMDEFWHAHILDTKAYAEDCRSVFGRFVHHNPYFGIYGEDDYQNLQNSFEKTKKIYFEAFGEYLDRRSEPKVVAARCEEHACHVPSSCACRVSGTCKNTNA